MSRLGTVIATKHRDVCDYMSSVEQSEPFSPKLECIPCTGYCDLCFANYPIENMIWNLTYEQT